MQLADANGPIYQKITEMATPTAGQAGVILAKPTEYIYSGILPTEDCPINWWLVGLLCILIVCIVITVNYLRKLNK